MMGTLTNQVRPWWDKTQVAIRETFVHEYIRTISYEKSEDNWGDGEEKGEHNKILQKVTTLRLSRVRCPAQTLAAPGRPQKQSRTPKRLNCALHF